MKKFKKKNNKGFSLVELIVVIAIMAVLMGVLAPTLIGNIEKSRESKDLQNLDSIRQAVVTAMATEGVYAAVVPSGAGATNDFTVSGNTLTGGSGAASITAEFSKIITGDTKMTCAAANGKNVLVKIGSNGAVEVGVYDGSTVVTATRNNVPMISK